MDAVTQCEVVAEATANGAPYMENLEGLAVFLKVSRNHVYKMMRAGRDLHPRLKEYFRGSGHQPYTMFNVSRLSHAEQLEWLAGRE